MATRIRPAIELASYLVDQLSGWADISTRPLFGAVALSRDDCVFAMIWRGSLYLKVDNKSRQEFESARSHPLSYVNKGKDMTLRSYWEVPADVLEDSEKLRAWAERAYQSAKRYR